MKSKASALLSTINKTTNEGDQEGFWGLILVRVGDKDPSDADYVVDPADVETIDGSQGADESVMFYTIETANNLIPQPPKFRYHLAKFTNGQWEAL